MLALAWVMLLLPLLLLQRGFFCCFFCFSHTDLWENFQPQVWTLAWICSRWRTRLSQANEQETAEIYNKNHQFFSWWNIWSFVYKSFEGLNPNFLTIGRFFFFKTRQQLKHFLTNVDLIFYLNERNFQFGTKMNDVIYKQWAAYLWRAGHGKI